MYIVIWAYPAFCHLSLHYKELINLLQFPLHFLDISKQYEYENEPALLVVFVLGSL